jgi:hypothetical protein
VIEVSGALGRHGKGQKIVQAFGGKTKGKRPLRRTRHRWEDGIRIDLGKIGLGGVDWI